MRNPGVGVTVVRKLRLAAVHEIDFLPGGATRQTLQAKHTHDTVERVFYSGVKTI